LRISVSEGNAESENLAVEVELEDLVVKPRLASMPPKASTPIPISSEMMSRDIQTLAVVEKTVLKSAIGISFA